MKKVLTGTGYTLARLAGILHEGWCMILERLPQGNDTMYGEGCITTNWLTQEVGLVCDTESPYHFLPEPHESRLIDVVEGDGWSDVESDKNE